MEDFDPITKWDTSTADRYVNHLRGDEEDAVNFLANYSANGKALEFAIGTGRIAIPLAKIGCTVEGIDGSPEMIAHLKADPTGKTIHAIVGDMSTTSMGSRYRLVYLVYNTIFNLLTVDDQIHCFENAFHHLSVEGHFIVETAVPHVWIEPGKSDYVKAEKVTPNEVGLDVARYDPATQIFEENHVTLTESGIKMNPMMHRLITPGEMDLMARIAGLRLVDRFGDWKRSEFNTDSIAHISVYAIA